MTARDDARSVLASPDAPASERFDAQAELQKAYRPVASDLIPAPDVQRAIHFIERSYQEQALLKAQARRDNILRFPDRVTAPPKRGVQSMVLDDMQIQLQGDYYERSAAMTFDQLRAMVEQTPVLKSVVLTRQRQVQRFCAPSEDGGIGFEIRHVDRKHQLSPDEEQATSLLGKFFQNCGWEFNPRKRKVLKRDNFSTFCAKYVADSLTMDSAPIETEMKRNKDLGIDGFYAIDGSTIRLCTEDGYQGDDEIFALQVVQGRICNAYTHDTLIYEVRNPTTDVRRYGYGQGETELLIKVVTGFLNAMTLNNSYFDMNSLPKGLLQIVGDYGEEDLEGFKRIWNSWVRGINNAWSLPVLAARDGDSKATWTPFNVEQNEMMFARWMTFLTSIICAIYGMSPDEINFESFTAGKSSLSGSDTTEKLAESKDKGLRPLLSHMENTFTDYIVSAFGEKYCFRWVGLDPEDEEKTWEAKKLVMTVDELRAEQGLQPHPDPQIGALPINPALIGPAMQLNHPPPQQPGQDFGGQGSGQDFGDEDTAESAGGQFGQGQGDDGQDPEAQGAPQEREFGGAAGGADFGKALSASAVYGLR
ncbi:Phage portal protein (plasmid) [Rhodovastum atsumiense]|uniref:Phage portal protein n=1 Tax=Rhodovastum atsumiense TaxID=504468 RepID=A0A5M6IUN5_9PROT|nr:phage portal protein [Rhodovastum atsumiense]KAA5611659.1 phage portal protein [Rhodovastum atsumiense]CAH2606241.1 Phage portal protein [Rhodovastum atsumiense]